MGHYSRHLHALTQESAGTYRARKEARKAHDASKAAEWFAKGLAAFTAKNYAAHCKDIAERIRIADSQKGQP